VNDKVKPIAFAVLTVIAAYFLATVFGKIGNSWRFFLPLDILVYLGIGFLSARTLRSWSGAFVVVAIAALVDVALAIGSLILPGAPRLSLALIVKAEVLDFVVNASIGLVGSAIGYATLRKPA
jgi:hypothetical protein